MEETGSQTHTAREDTLMTVRELRQLLVDVKDQNAVVKMNGENIQGLQTAFGGTLVRLLGADTESDWLDAPTPPFSVS
jgi:hypothetical protein